MSFTKNKDARSTFSTDSLRLKDKREQVTAPPVGGWELYMKDGVLTSMDSDGVETLVAPVPTAAAGTVVQVVSVTKLDTYTTTTTGIEDVPGLSVTITPKSIVNKILITGVICWGQGTATPYLAGFLLIRGSTAINQAAAAGNRSCWTFGSQSYTSDGTAFAPLNYLDSPATVAVTTYKIQVKAEPGSSLVYINRGNEADGNNAITGRFTSTITLMEIAG